MAGLAAHGGAARAAAPRRARARGRSSFRNARDCALAAPGARLAAQRLVRTATWGELPTREALEAQVKALVGEGADGATPHAPVTLLDLRSAEEYGDDAGALPEMLPPQPVDADSVSAAADAHAPPAEAGTLHRVNISLLERERYERGLFNALPLREKLYVLWLKVFGGRNELRDWFIGTRRDPRLMHSASCEHSVGFALSTHADTPTPLAPQSARINEGGLPQLYELLLETGSADFAVALKTVVCNLEAGRSVVFFCKAGKDRTGLMAMLMLLVLGASEGEVIEDYARSDSDETVAGLGGVEKKAPGLVRGASTGACMPRLAHTWVSVADMC